jgi:hypothetical protein
MTVIWATGYRPAYPWLPDLAVDQHGEIRHRRGVTDIPGLYVLSLKFRTIAWPTPAMPDCAGRASIRHGPDSSDG